MIRDTRLKTALAALPPADRAALVPVLGALAHDLNSSISAVVLEAFAIGQLVADGDQLSGSQLENVREAVRNLELAAGASADYVTQLQRHVEDGSGVEQ